MYNVIGNILAVAVQKAAFSFVINGYFGAKDYFMGQKEGQDAVTECSKKVAQDVGYETARNGLNQIVDVMPGGPLVQAVAHAGVDMTVNGTRAGIEGKDVAKTVAKNGCYALNTAIAGPICAIPLNMATDWAVDRAADAMTFAYTNYQNGCSQKAYQMDPRNNSQTDLGADIAEQEFDAMLMAP